jgi:hypothetical protein
MKREHTIKSGLIGRLLLALVCSVAFTAWVTAAPAKTRPAGNKLAADGVSVGTLWRGTLQAGSSPSQKLELTIMQRDGEDFKGRITFNGRNPAGANGTISGNAISWNLLMRGQLTELKYTGELHGKQMKGNFSGPGSNNQTVEGTFILDLVPGGRK